MSESQYTFVDFVNELLGLEGDDRYEDEEEVCTQFKQASVDYAWELYQALK